MHDALNLLEDCFSPPKGKMTKSLKPRQVKKQGKGISVSFENCNANQNSRIRPKVSEETIYDNAVQKRASSSSDENLELSDESFNNEISILAGNKSVDGRVRQSP